MPHKDPDKAFHYEWNRRPEVKAHEKKVQKLQNNSCAICKIKFTNISKKSNSMMVDHNHKIKKFKGLVCQSCNFLLGNSHDNPNVLKAAAIYLNKENR